MKAFFMAFYQRRRNLGGAKPYGGRLFCRPPYAFVEAYCRTN